MRDTAEPTADADAVSTGWGVSTEFEFQIDTVRGVMHLMLCPSFLRRIADDVAPLPPFQRWIDEPVSAEVRAAAASSEVRRRWTRSAGQLADAVAAHAAASKRFQSADLRRQSALVDLPDGLAGLLQGLDTEMAMASRDRDQATADRRTLEPLVAAARTAAVEELSTVVRSAANVVAKEMIGRMAVAIRRDLPAAVAHVLDELAAARMGLLAAQDTAALARQHVTAVLAEEWVTVDAEAAAPLESMSPTEPTAKRSRTRVTT
jgi:hypothetical protein